MAIKLDVSPSSIVVYCTECTGWQQLATNKTTARRIVTQHALQVHGSQSREGDAASTWLRRHADTPTFA